MASGSFDGDIFDETQNPPQRPPLAELDAVSSSSSLAENTKKQNPFRQLFPGLQRANETTPENNPTAMPSTSALQATPQQHKQPEAPGADVTPSRCKASLSVSPVKCVNRKRSSSEPIKTLVFCDFETTGLFAENSLVSPALKKTRNSYEFANELNRLIMNTQTASFPRMTEMAFLAVQRETFVKAMNKMHERCSQADPKTSLRVRVPSNVHTRQVNPSISEEEWQKYEASRARNPQAIVHEKFDLTFKNDFKTEWIQLRAFLESLPKPACLVAHNGIGFDFRVLFGELYRHNLHKNKETTIPDGIMFVDSLIAAQNIDDKLKQSISAVIKGIDWRMIREQLRLPVAAPDATTPDVNGAPSDALPLDHPLNFVNKTLWSPAQKRKWTAKSFKHSADGQWELVQEGHRYGLGVLYNNVVKGYFESHYAQDDSEALLQICLAYGEEFLEYMDTCAADVPF